MAVTSKGLIWTEVPTWDVKLETSRGVYRLFRIAFYPIPKDKSVSGFSHRVIINDRPMDWLGDSFAVNRKNALFFLEKHEEIVRNRQQQEVV